MEEADTLAKTQTLTIPCAEFVYEHQEKINYDKIAETRHSICKNRSSRVGEKIGLISPDDLTSYKENGHTWCFTYADVDDIKKTGINPYTGKPIPKYDIKNFNKIPHIYVPLDVSLRNLAYNDTCPLFHSSASNIGYISLPHEKEPYILDDFPNNSKFEVIKYTDPGGGGSDVYEVKVNTKVVYLPDNLIDISYVPKKWIISLKRVYNSAIDETKDPIESTDKYELDKSAEKDLKEYINKDIIPSNQLWQYLEQVKQKLEIAKDDVEIKLIKGILFNDALKEIGANIDLTFHYPSNWSTNICSATSEALKYRQGAVVSIIVSSKAIIIDLRYTTFQLPYIILFPGIYTITVEMFTYPYSAYARHKIKDTPDISHRVVDILNTITN